MKTVESERGEYTLNTLSPCKVSVNTMALFDPGLVSSSRFRSRRLTPPPPLPVHQEIALFPWGQILQSRLLSGLKPAWSYHNSEGAHLAGQTGSFVRRRGASILSFVIQRVFHDAHFVCLSCFECYLQGQKTCVDHLRHRCSFVYVSHT